MGAACVAYAASFSCWWLGGVGGLPYLRLDASAEAIEAALGEMYRVREKYGF
jgi:hypothetical protein